MSATRLRALLCCAAALAGCAGTSMPPGPAFSAQAGMDQVTLGKSTKAQVAGTLGKATVIPFDSGYQVWVYRWPGPEGTPRAATELVLLFNPSGVATKARVRPGYAP